MTNQQTDRECERTHKPYSKIIPFHLLLPFFFLLLCFTTSWIMSSRALFFGEMFNDLLCLIIQPQTMNVPNTMNMRLKIPPPTKCLYLIVIINDSAPNRYNTIPISKTLSSLSSIVLEYLAKSFKSICPSFKFLYHCLFWLSFHALLTRCMTIYSLFSIHNIKS